MHIYIFNCIEQNSKSKTSRFNILHLEQFSLLQLLTVNTFNGR